VSKKDAPARTMRLVSKQWEPIADLSLVTHIIHAKNSHTGLCRVREAVVFADWRCSRRLRDIVHSSLVVTGMQQCKCIGTAHTGTQSSCPLLIVKICAGWCCLLSLLHTPQCLTYDVLPAHLTFLVFFNSPLHSLPSTLSLLQDGADGWQIKCRHYRLHQQEI
jgi:hypothetical protein